MHTFTVRHIASQVAGQVIGNGDALIAGVANLDEATPGQITFIGDASYAKRWPRSRASAALVTARLSDGLKPGEGQALILVPNADLAMAIVLELFAPPAPVAGLPTKDLELATAHKGHVAIHPSAIVDATAQIGKAVRIGANCVVGPRVVIGDRTVLYSGVTLMDDSRVGHDGVIWPGVVIRERCTVGDRCILHANVVIGADGFGYRPAPGGKGLVKIPQIGHVEIGHDVELGAATTIDRGKFSTTVLGDGCKIDNLCHIAHNCRLGRGVVMAAQVGLAGSVTVGDGVMFGGKAGVGDHVTIGAGAQIGAFCGVFQDVEPGARVIGQPATDTRQFFRQVAALQRLPEMMKQWKAEGRAGSGGGKEGREGKE